MAYDRFDTRRGWREPRQEDRYGRGPDRDFEGREDRGFFERAGDEVASWFGDEEAERRRREDMRFRGEEDFSRYDRQPRFRDEGYRRPYTGRFFGRRGFGEEDRFERGSPPDRGTEGQFEAGRRDFSGTAASGLHDPHYSEWRRRQIDALDRDYEEYRRENQSRFENEFSDWRAARQGKRQLLGEVREHMNVVGSDEEHVGTVDCVRGDHVILTKGDSEDNRHHLLSCSLVDRIEGDKLVLDRPAAEVKRELLGEGRPSGFIRDEAERDTGPHMLNRSFSGTYER